MEQHLCLNWQQLVAKAKKRRKDQGLTQNDLCALINMSKPTLVSFEKGETKISLENAFKILKVLGLLCKKST